MSDELIHIGGVFLETELTKKLKKAIHNYRAIMPTKMRTLRYADEVWTPTGIVDSIRFEDIPIKAYNGCKNLNITNYANMVLTFKKMAIIAKVVFITHTVSQKPGYVSLASSARFL